MERSDEYPGLEATVRRQFEKAREGLPKDVGIGIMFAFHYGPENIGGMAWVAGTAREDAISLVTEWLARQVEEGHGEVVRVAMDKWFNRKGHKP